MMNNGKNENMEYSHDSRQQERRSFLKKALYATPSLIVLGQLSRPTKTNADGFGATPSDPNTD